MVNCAEDRVPRKEKAFSIASRVLVWPNQHRTRARKFERKPFDFACMQCEHSHSCTQVPSALHCVGCHVWMRPFFFLTLPPTCFLDTHGTAGFFSQQRCADSPVFKDGTSLTSCMSSPCQNKLQHCTEQDNAFRNELTRRASLSCRLRQWPRAE